MKYILTLMLALLATLPVAAQSAAQPNIVFILADDLGYGDVGCYNSEAKVATPNLDRLAREGMRFTDAHSPSTVCTPSRYSLLTGRLAFRIPYRSVFEGVGGPCLIKDDQLTLPQLLRNQGYTTAMTGKWHVGLSFFDTNGQRITQGGIEGVRQIDYSRAIPDSPIHRGFDSFFGTACCPGTDYLYAYIDGDRIPVPPTGTLDKSKLPKHPYAFDNRMGMVAPGYDIEEVDQVFLKKSQEFLEKHKKNNPKKPFFLLHSMNAVHLPSFASKRFQGSTKTGPHGDFIHELDEIVGELLKTLKRLGLDKNTVVMFSSDNGTEVSTALQMRTDFGHDGARPWRGVKRDQWEGGHRVPFIVRWPGKIAAGSKSDQTVCLTDVMATCAAITGTTLPDDSAQDSFDLLPVLLGKKQDGPVRPYTIHQTISLALAIRKGPWKYLDHKGSGGNNYDTPQLKRYALPDTAPGAPGQLYNLETDPGETTNLYFKHPEVVQELKTLLESSKSEGRSAPRRQQPSHAADPPKPNIILILADDLGTGHVGWQNPKVKTPHLDRLANAGIKLNRHYVAPVCSPTRVALLTGRYWSRFGCNGALPSELDSPAVAMPPGTPTLSATLKVAGYRTALVGKWHLGAPLESGPETFGFDHFYGLRVGGMTPLSHQWLGEGKSALWRNKNVVEEPGHITDLLAREAVDWIGKASKRPFFLYLAFTAPHVPLSEPEPWMNLYKSPEIDLSHQLYWAAISHLDDAVGKVVVELERLGQRDNTLIIFLSDNGAPGQPNWMQVKQYLENYPKVPLPAENLPFRGSKGTVYEGGIRTPAFVSWPGKLTPGVCDAPLSVTDWMPTLSALVRGEPKRDLTWDGLDILPVLRGSATPPQPRVFYTKGPNRASSINEGDWKLVVTDKAVELYNLMKDHGEKNNLAVQNPERVGRLQALLEAQIARDNDAVPSQKERKSVQ